METKLKKLLVIVAIAISFYAGVQYEQSKGSVVLVWGPPAPHPHHLLPERLPAPEEFGVDSYTIDPFYFEPPLEDPFADFEVNPFKEEE